MVEWVFNETQLEQALAEWLHDRSPQPSDAEADRVIDLILEFMHSKAMHAAGLIADHQSSTKLQ